MGFIYCNILNSFSLQSKVTSNYFCHATMEIEEVLRFRFLAIWDLQVLIFKKHRLFSFSTWGIPSYH